MAIGAAMGAIIPLAMWLDRSPDAAPVGISDVAGIASFILIGAALGRHARFVPVAIGTALGALAASAIWLSQSGFGQTPTMTPGGILIFAVLGAFVGSLCLGKTKRPPSAALGEHVRSRLSSKAEDPTSLAAEAPMPQGDRRMGSGFREASGSGRAAAKLAHSGGTWESTSRNWSICVIGLLAFFGGLSLVAVGIRNQLGSSEHPVFAPVLGGLAMAAMGAAAVTFRTGITIDRRTYSVTTWTKWLLFSKEHHLPVSAFEGVSISRELRREHSDNGGSRTYTVFAVRLIGSTEETLVHDYSTCQHARKKGEELAKFLDMPLSDWTSGEEVVRSPDELDQSLRDRIRSQGDTQKVTDPPTEMRSTCNLEGELLHINIPSQQPFFGGVDLGYGVLWLGGLCYLLIFPKKLSAFYANAPFMFWFWFLSFPCMVAWHFLYKVREEQVVASPRHLQVTKRHLVGRKTVEISASELEELVVHASTGITARSDDEMVQFGADLATEELRWLHATIQSTLTS